jgi:ectoine hydroxylase-related dioxygenase (phytanoyl-CoA dioxygenase family)
MSVLTESDHSFFKQNGYVVLTDLLSAQELKRFVGIFDTDRSDHRYRWHSYGYHQSANYDALITSSAFDEMVRHRAVLSAVEELMGGPTCFGEIGARHVRDYSGDLHRSWHRDRPHWSEHRYRMDYIQSMLYLTDVNSGTHCFSLSPESIDQPVIKDQDDQLARGGIVDILGPAGTVCLFNVSVLHTATTRQTTAERKSVQTYYGHRDRVPLANDSVIPSRLWKDDPDPETRAFYGNLKDVTKIYSEAFGIGA